MARAHEPKLGALAALHEGRLSAASARRLEHHLAACAVCRGALRGLRRYAALLPEVQRAPAPDLDWAKLDRGLQRELRAGARRQQRAFAGGLLAATAAVGLLIWPQGSREPSSLPQPVAARARPQKGAALSAHVLALAGDVYAYDAQDQPVRLSVDTLPTKGWLLRTGANGELHFALHDAASVLVPADSEVRLAELQSDSIRLALHAGSVVSKVQRRTSDERYEIAASEHVVSVRGTHFAVTLGPSGLEVDVVEGTVAVRAHDGSEIAELVAPRSWRAQPSSQARGPVVRRPLGLMNGALALLELPTAPRVVAWDFLDADLSAAAELRMRAPPGEYELGALLAGGGRMTAKVRVDLLGTRFDPQSLRFDGQAVTTARKIRGTLDPAAARATIRDAQPALQRCYERSLRNEPASALRVRMRVALEPRGQVKRIELSSDGATVSPALAACIEQVGLRLQFEPPGGDGAVFDAPLAFQPMN